MARGLLFSLYSGRVLGLSPLPPESRRGRVLVRIEAEEGGEQCRPQGPDLSVSLNALGIAIESKRELSGDPGANGFETVPCSIHVGTRRAHQAARTHS